MFCRRQELMDRRFLKRYVVLVFILVLCACAAWYVTKETGQPYADAVLVKQTEECCADGVKWQEVSSYVR